MRSVGDRVGFADNGSSRAASPFQPGAVVHGLSESLCAAQVPLGGLDGHVAEQKLNLFQLAACRVTETSARSVAVVRCQPLHPSRLAILLHYVPHHLIGYPAAPDAPVGTEAVDNVPRLVVK